ncbi:sigma-70 family RNA polymerase sigma factor [Dactylosporangium sp. NPDC049140]|uniref:sigma-70 family RNA polymerase sigma factor n=1 Tax=Dactylosporangium sp. NPDC049140 TaxID=3155647 RepID=UPI0034063CB2
MQSIPSAIATAPPPRSGTIPAADASSRTEQLLRARDRLPVGNPLRATLRAQAIVGMLPLAQRLARRYAGRGELLEDLTQVAALALVKAVDRYDSARPASFVGYAVPTIVGELKRHFRDTGWAMRVPRLVQELTMNLQTATGELEQLRGRTPTAAELAAHLHVEAGQLANAIGATHVYRVHSFDAGPTGDGDLLDVIGTADPRFAAVDERLSHGLLGRLVAELPTREQRILAMRFTDEMTQASIASALGISQMHVSRLLRHSLHELRAGIRNPSRALPEPPHSVTALTMS